MFNKAYKNIVKSVQIKNDVLSTPIGDIQVTTQGDTRLPKMITFHDIGLNSKSNFLSFFNHPDTIMFMEKFCVYFVSAPGQDEKADPLPKDFIFPRMDGLSKLISYVIEFYGITQFIGLGYGAGAYVLSYYAMTNPARVIGLILFNPNRKEVSWHEWMVKKRVFVPYSKGITSQALDYLMWHHFGSYPNHEDQRALYKQYKLYFSSRVEPYNLTLFIDAYLKRDKLNLIRNSEKPKEAIKCPVLIIVGSLNHYTSEAHNMANHLNRETTTTMVVSDCILPLEEQPEKVAEAIHLFVQGLGYAPSIVRIRSFASPYASALTEGGGSGLFRHVSSNHSSMLEDPLFAPVKKQSMKQLFKHTDVSLRSLKKKASKRSNDFFTDAKKTAKGEAEVVLKTSRVEIQPDMIEEEEEEEIIQQVTTINRPVLEKP